MFKKQFSSIEALKNELIARNILKNQFVTSATSTNYDRLIILFDNRSYVNLDDLVWNYNKYPFCENFLYFIVVGMCEAIKHLNKKGLIHLDLKPSNILIDIDFNVKLNDFEDYVDVNNPPRVLPVAKGNFLYRSPERDTANYGIESNIFSLGLLIYFLIHGHHPYTGLNQDEIIEWKKSWKIEYSPILHPLLSYTIDNCINPDPAKRFIFDINDVEFDGLTFDMIHAFSLMYHLSYSFQFDFNYADDQRQYFFHIANSILYFPGDGFKPEQLMILLKFYNEYIDKNVIIFDEYYLFGSFLNQRLHMALIDEAAISKDELLYTAIICDSYLDYAKRFGIDGLNESDFLDASATVPQFLSYQMLVGKGVALDVVEGTYKCIADMNFQKHLNYSYYIIQPIIMAHFPDAAELLCLDFYIYRDLVSSLGMSLVFDFIAPDELDILAYWDFAKFISDNKMQKVLERGGKVIHIVLGATMQQEMEPNSDFFLSYFSHNDYPISIVEFEHLAPQLKVYFQMYTIFLMRGHVIRVHHL